MSVITLAKTLHLVWVSALPWWAPLEPMWDRPTSARVVASLLFLSLLPAIALFSWRKRALWAACSSLATLLALLVLAQRFQGAHGPLGRGAMWVAPLLWITVLTTAQLLLGDRLPAPARAPRIAIAAGLGIAALSLLASADRLFGRETQWRTVLARDPGNEVAAIALADLLAADKRGGEAQTFLRACADARPTSCTCAVRASAPDVDASNGGKAIALLDRAAPTCGSSSAFVALRADALSQVARYSEAIVEADRALSSNANDAHALYARGIAALAAKDVANALSLGQRADAAGRGTPARLLVGGAQLLSGDLEGAKKTFESAAAADPMSAAARYHVGLLADRGNHYRDAREAYLHALRLDPTFADARYALAVLTARNGAKPEAKHHLEKLREIAPTDARIAALEKMLAEP